MSDESYSSSQENVVAKAKYDAPSQWQQQVKVLKQMMALDQPNPVRLLRHIILYVTDIWIENISISMALNDM